MPAILPLLPVRPVAEISIATNGMTEGISQTDGVQVIPRMYLRAGDFQLGGLWRNIKSSQASGVAVFFLKYARSSPKLHIEGRIAYRLRTNPNPVAKRTTWEFFAAAERPFGPLTWRVSAEFTPDDFGAGKSLFVESGPTIRLDRATEVTINVGDRLRQHAAYRSFNVGISHRLAKSVTLDLRYFATDRPNLGSHYEGRLVLAAKLSL